MQLSPFYQELFTSLNRGVIMSIALIIPSAVGGVLIGILAGVVRTFGGRIARAIGDGYAAVFRGTPLVVQLFVLYFGLPNLGIYFTPYAAAVTGFTLCSGAYQSEYVRGRYSRSSAGSTWAPRHWGSPPFRPFSGSSSPRPYDGLSMGAATRSSI